MSSLFSTLNIGRQAIYTNQLGLRTVGNNIANVSTEGYARQRMVVSSEADGGVRVDGVQRITDQFFNARLNLSSSRVGTLEALSLNLQQMEGVLNDMQDMGVNASLTDFFESFQNLSLKPGGTIERESVSLRASQLISTLGNVTSQLQQIREQVDRQVRQQVTRVNDLTGQIADINSRLASMDGQVVPGSESDLNQMLDSRQRLVNELSTMMPIQVNTNHGRSAMTIISAGQVLIDGASNYELEVRSDATNSNFAQVVRPDLGGKYNVITDDLNEGSLAGLLEARDGQGREIIDNIDRLAATLMREVNIQHRAGTGLDGVTGRNFFTGLDVAANDHFNNVGGAQVASTQLLDDTLLTFDDYEIRFNDAPPMQYDVVNLTTGTTVSAGNNYVSGTPIDFDGMRVTISNLTGSPAGGDVFRVNSYADTTQRMDLHADIKADVQSIAAGLSAEYGDNRNALALAALRDGAIAPGGVNFEQYYDRARLNLAMATESSQRLLKEEEVIHAQVESLVDSTQGVSIDEEATNMIQYQRAFEAASRVIRMTDEMMQVIVNMV